MCFPQCIRSDIPIEVNWRDISWETVNHMNRVRLRGTVEQSRYHLNNPSEGLIWVEPKRWVHFDRIARTVVRTWKTYLEANLRRSLNWSLNAMLWTLNKCCPALRSPQPRDRLIPISPSNHKNNTRVRRAANVLQSYSIPVITEHQNWVIAGVVVLQKPLP